MLLSFTGITLLCLYRSLWSFPFVPLHAAAGVRFLRAPPLFGFLFTLSGRRTSSAACHRGPLKPSGVERRAAHDVEVVLGGKAFGLGLLRGGEEPLDLFRRWHSRPASHRGRRSGPRPPVVVLWVFRRVT
uniref:Secreted protein n=1 Tax=Arundo donax TaxID=35708 RepID=A0A0A9FA95_ARUDO